MTKMRTQGVKVVTTQIFFISKSAATVGNISKQHKGPDQVQLTIFEIVSKKIDNLSCQLLYNAL